MFFQFNKEIDKMDVDDVDFSLFTAGYVNSSELPVLAKKFGFAKSTVEACKSANPYFRTDVDVHADYTFSELRIVNESGADDWIALYIMKNLVLVVDVLDNDGSTEKSFNKTLEKYNNQSIKQEKFICSFIESLISGGTKDIEIMHNGVTEMEEMVINGKVDRRFNLKILAMKKRLLKLHNYYEQLLDIIETLKENDNDILEVGNLIYILNLSNKIDRLKDGVDSLVNLVDHLQDAYSSLLDQKLNQTMKIFTVITTIFFPLTIIVGWYGMNFKYMPELTWKYGYVYVIALSVAVVLSLTIFGKKKKWF